MVDRILIVACGPSVAGCDLSVPNAVHVIAVNAAVTWAPVVHTFFSLDPSTYVISLLCQRRGIRYVMAVPEDYGTPNARNRMHRRPLPQGVTRMLRVTGNGVRGSSCGLSEDPGSIHTGNSAFGALGLAYHMRPTKIAMVGVDGLGGYAYASGGPRWSLEHLPALFESAVYQINARDIQVVNGSADSSVTCFPRMAPEAAIRWLVEDK